MQIQDAEQLGQTRVGLQELARFDIDPQLSVKARVVEREGRSLPVDIATQPALAAAQHILHAEATEQCPGVRDVELEVHRRAARYATSTRRHAGDCRPRALRSKGGFGHGEAELVELPFTRCTAQVDGIDFDTAKPLAEQLEIIDHHIECGQGVWLLVEQRLDLVRLARCDLQSRQPRVQATGLRMPVFGIAAEFDGVDVGAPQRAVARATQHHIVQRAARHRELFGAHRDQRRQIRERIVGVVGVGHGLGRAASRLSEERLPCCKVESLQDDVRLHARRRRWRRFARVQPDRDKAAQHFGIVTRHIADVLRRSDLAELDQQLVLHQRCAACTRLARQHLLFDLKWHRFIGRLGKRGRQLQAKADEAAGEQELGGAVAHRQRSCVVGTARRLGCQPRQPIDLARSAQSFRRRAARHFEAHVLRRGPAPTRRCAKAALAFNMRNAAQKTRLHVGQGKTALVEVQSAARLAQCRHLRRQLQLVVGERDAGLHLGLVDGRQRQVELEPVVRVAGGAHVGHRGAERSGQRRAGMQQFGQRAARLGIDSEQRVCMRHVGDLRLGLVDLDARCPDDVAARIAHQQAGTFEHQLS